jgi:hypothetical protein
MVVLMLSGHDALLVLVVMVVLRLPVRLELALQKPGANAMICKIISPKSLRKNGRFCHKMRLFMTRLI